MELAYFRIKTGKTLGKLHWKSRILLHRNGMAAISKMLWSSNRWNSITWKFETFWAMNLFLEFNHCWVVLHFGSLAQELMACLGRCPKLDYYKVKGCYLVKLVLCLVIGLFNLIESQTWWINSSTITLHNHECIQR